MKNNEIPNWIKAGTNIDIDIEWDWECPECNNKLKYEQSCDHGDFVVQVYITKDNVEEIV